MSKVVDIHVAKVQKPCVFFDRDGIVNRSPGPGYVERVEDFEIIPKFLEALAVVNRHGYEAVIVTNQRGVALGRLTEETLEEIHRRLLEEVEARGLRITDILYCPHDFDDCECRKPEPGMLLEAAARHRLDLGRSWMVGDSERDIEAGRRAGCRTVRIAEESVSTQADYHLYSVDDLPEFLEEHLE